MAKEITHDRSRMWGTLTITIYVLVILPVSYLRSCSSESKLNEQHPITLHINLKLKHTK